ncbi:DNA gyrase subunit A [subsurface metagenome]
MSRQSKGRNIVNLLKLGSQQMASIINVSTFDGEGEEDAQQRQLIMATKNGLVKKTKLSAYSNPRTTGVIAINLDPNDDLIGVALTVSSDHVVLGTRDGMTIRFDEGQVRSMGRASRGVRGIKLRPGDTVVDMVIVEEKAALFTVCENGYGKRTSLGNYRPQSRGGVGLKNIKTTARNGKVVALKAVQNKDDLVMITANGMIIRTGLDQIRSIGRNTQGVRLIKLKGGDKLVAAEKITAEDAKNNAKDKSGSNQKSQPAAEAKAEPKPKPKLKPKPKSKSKPKAKPKSKPKRRISKKAKRRK